MILFPQMSTLTPVHRTLKLPRPSKIRVESAGTGLSRPAEACKYQVDNSQQNSEARPSRKEFSQRLLSSIFIGADIFISKAMTSTRNQRQTERSQNIDALKILLEQRAMWREETQNGALRFLKGSSSSPSVAPSRRQRAMGRKLVCL